MTFEPYRRVLAVPGIRTLLVVGLLARIPLTATGMALTLYVVNDLDLGFARAGLIGAAATGGAALGAPIVGRFVDRHGLRPVMTITTVSQVVFWSAAPLLPYLPLLIGAFAGGVLMPPVFSLIRQCLAAVVPEDGRRTAFALDSMIVEISYMVGPAAAVAVATSVDSTWSLGLVGLGVAASGVAFIVLNPPTRGADEPLTLASDSTDTANTAQTGDAVVAAKAGLVARFIARRQWLTPSMGALLTVTFAAAFVLTATELSMVAVLKAGSAVQWTGLVMGLWCLASLVGGFVYGALPRGFSPLVLVGGMAVLTVPVGLVGHWSLLCLALIPCGVLCAPALSTTIDTLSGWVPAAVRGEAMGLHGTALTLGLAVSGPITGFLIDDLGTRWSFALTGLGGLLLVVLVMPLWRRTAPATVRSHPVPEAA